MGNVLIFAIFLVKVTKEQRKGEFIMAYDLSRYSYGRQGRRQAALWRTQGGVGFACSCLLSGIGVRCKREDLPPETVPSSIPFLKVTQLCKTSPPAGD